jgi:hypothetical protein
MIEFIYYTGADEYTKKGGYTEEGTPNVFVLVNEWVCPTNSDA